jgi:hypothetical protein
MYCIQILLPPFPSPDFLLVILHVYMAIVKETIQSLNNILKIN